VRGTKEIINELNKESKYIKKIEVKNCDVMFDIGMNVS